jgi:hypothetical protein
MMRDGGPPFSEQAARPADAIARMCALSPQGVSDWKAVLALSGTAVDAVDRGAWPAR